MLNSTYFLCLHVVRICILNVQGIFVNFYMIMRDFKGPPDVIVGEKWLKGYFNRIGLSTNI